jgi:hypothetical protein
LFVKFQLIFLVLFSSLSLLVQAYQPQLLQQTFTRQKASGAAKNIRGQIGFINNTQSSIHISPIRIKTRSYTFSFIPEKKHIGPKEKITVNFKAEFYQAGSFQILAKLPIVVARKSVRKHTIELYYLVKKLGNRNLYFTVSTYKKLYLDKGIRKEAGMGRVFKSYRETPKFPHAKTKRLPLLNKIKTIPSRDSIYKIPTRSSNNKQISADTTHSLELYNESSELESYTLSPQNHQLATATTARGKFSWLGTDNHYHRAFGWRVRAWTRRNSSSSWKKRAEDWIQWDGSWRLQFSRPSGHKVKFQYIASNRFFKPQNNSGDSYRWVGPEHANIASVHNEGSWFANTSSGNVRGLGEMYHEGMLLWSKLYWQASINPLRNKQIRIFFPNLSYDCGSGSGNPWSCASTDGRIWLIPAHALAQGVTAHELAHQINYEFWNNQRPPNAGGSHTLTGCFTKGLALLEGFANFMTVWMYNNRSTPNPSAFGVNIETLPASVCTNISRNESYVAATFWDLHDKHTDNNDNLWFIHPGAVAGLYLRSGKKNSMQAFRTTYRNAANNEHRHIIDDIFVQNKNHIQLTN